MNDTATLAPPTEAPVTRRDLATRGMDALDPNKAGLTKVNGAAGGVAFASALEVMDFAKLMAVAGTAVPKHLRNNPGACLRIVFQAVEWRMSPWGVADKSYEVNDRIAYESQLLHAVIEARAPLQHRLDCRYEGEGPTRTCTVIGTFIGGEVREYTTPEFQKIKVKNSPLWTADPDQQLFYYASRSWARKWCPDVLLGIYTRDELDENAALGREEEPRLPGLHARLQGAPKSDEGHKDGHAGSELDQVAAGGGAITDAKAEPSVTETSAKDGKKKKVGGIKPEDATPEKPAEEQKALEPPKNAAEWKIYATAWIAASTDADENDKRWAKERKLRNSIGVTADDRLPIEALLVDRREKLTKKK